MKKLFVFGENSRHPQQIEVSDETSSKDILFTYHRQLGIPGTDDSYHLFREDEEHAVGHGSGHSPNFKDKDRIQCHRCQHIDVTLIYNNKHVQVSFNPAATGARILAHLHKHFPGVTPKDAANLRLQISKDVFLDKDEHLGSFVQYPHCHLEIHLVPKVNIQG